MEYLLTIYGDEKAMATMSQEEMGSIMAEWFKYDEELRKAVQVLSGNPLQPTATATTVRSKDGQVITSDGPFAETKEQLGGYYLIDARGSGRGNRMGGKDAEHPRRRIGGGSSHHGHAPINKVLESSRGGLVLAAGGRVDRQ